MRLKLYTTISTEQIQFLVFKKITNILELVVTGRNNKNTNNNDNNNNHAVMKRF